MSSGLERRQFKRFDFHRDMQLRIFDSFKAVSAIDISREGVGFVCEKHLEVGEEIDVVLYVGEAIEMPLMLTVVICNDIGDKKFRVGTIMQVEDVDLLEKLIVAFNDELDN